MNLNILPIKLKNNDFYIMNKNEQLNNILYNSINTSLVSWVSWDSWDSLV